MGSIQEQKLIDELLGDLENDRLILPTLPEVALKVRDTLEDESMGLPEVAKVITSDAALSARLIQITNSPLLRSSRQIETVEAAVARMGSDMVRNLVMSIVMEQMFQATSTATDSRLRALWEHSTDVAAISHALAARYTTLHADLALLIGLIHDIGTLPILSYAEDIPGLLDDEELLDHIIDQTHVKISTAILTKWKFSDDMIRAVSEHENLAYDSDKDKPDYADVAIVANLQSYIGTSHKLNDLDWNTIPSFQKLGLKGNVNVVTMDKIKEDIQSIKSVLRSS